MAVHVRDVHDAPAYRPQQRRRGLREKERCGEIGADEVPPLPFRGLADRGRVEGGGVVDQGIETSPALRSRRDHGRGRSRLDEVRVHRHRSSRPGVLQLLAETFGFLPGAMAVNRDRHAGGVQVARDPRAHAPARPGHESDRLSHRRSVGGTRAAR